MEITETSLPQKEKNNGLIHFIELEKPQSKTIRIPCSNQNIANKVIASCKVISARQEIKSLQPQL